MFTNRLVLTPTKNFGRPGPLRGEGRASRGHFKFDRGGAERGHFRFDRGRGGAGPLKIPIKKHFRTYSDFLDNVEYEIIQHMCIISAFKAMNSKIESSLSFLEEVHIFALA